MTRRHLFSILGGALAAFLALRFRLFPHECRNFKREDGPKQHHANGAWSQEHTSTCLECGEVWRSTTAHLPGVESVNAVPLSFIGSGQAPDAYDPDAIADKVLASYQRVIQQAKADGYKFTVTSCYDLPGVPS